MNYVQYDPDTGKFFSCGNMTESTLDSVIEAGHPVIRVTEWPEDFDMRLYDVDLATKSLVRNSYVIPPPEPPPVPPAPQLVISDRQFFQQAAIEGYISKADALAAVQTGFIPGPLQAIVDQIADADEKFAAQMLLSGATIFYREHWLTDQIGLAMGMTPEQIDAFFTAASTL